jgi:hypothetical protein
MKRIFTSLVVLLFATSVYSQGVDRNAGIQATTYSDGVLFEPGHSNNEFMLNISGPENTVIKKRYSSAEPAFFSVNNENGWPLPDGLYKYEARAIPAFSISREESSKLRDRNILIGKSDPKSSPVSGHFRIINGVVVDKSLEEYSARGAK